MIKKKFTMIIFNIFFILAMPADGYTARTQQGDIIVRIPDGATPRCVNLSTDVISLHLKKLILDKDVGWFTEDKEYGLLLQTTIYGLQNGENRKVSFPLMFKGTLENFHAGSVALPIEQTVFNQFKLKSLKEPTSYNRVDLEFTVLKKHKPSSFGLALSQLVKVSNLFPVPTEPFSLGFKFFVEYSKGLLDQSLNNKNNVDQQIKGGKITLPFSPTGVCSGAMEKTGTLAIIRGTTEKNNPEFVNVENEYCWQAQMQPTFEIRFAKKPNNEDCNKALVYQKIRNTYFGFFLNAFSLKPSGKGASALGLTDRMASLQRCRFNGVNEKDCF